MPPNATDSIALRSSQNGMIALPFQSDRSTVDRGAFGEVPKASTRRRKSINRVGPSRGVGGPRSDGTEPIFPPQNHNFRIAAATN